MLGVPHSRRRSSDSLLKTLITLAQDLNVDVRYAIAENHNIHADVLNILLDDDNPFVAHRAQKTVRALPARGINCPFLLSEKPSRSFANWPSTCQLEDFT